MEHNLVELKIADVVLRYPLRKDNGDLNALEDSIRRLGLLCPVIVDCHNVLICGGRRLQASKNIGLTTIKAFRLGVEAGSLRAMDMQSDENLCRQPLSPEELTAHIEAKKCAAGERQATGLAGVVSSLQSLFRSGERKSG